MSLRGRGKRWKERIHGERETKLSMPSTHIHTGIDTIIIHGKLTELHIYTSLAPCLLPSVLSTMISLHTSKIILLTFNLSMLHNLSAEIAPSEDLIERMRDRFHLCFFLCDIRLEDNSRHIVPTA